MNRLKRLWNSIKLKTTTPLAVNVQRLVSTRKKPKQHIVCFVAPDRDRKICELVVRTDGGGRYMIHLGNDGIYLTREELLRAWNAFDSILSWNLLCYIRTVAFRTTRRTFSRIIAAFT